MKRLITKILGIPSALYNAVVLRYRKVQCKGKLTIHGKLRLFGHGKIVVGDEVIINSCLSSNPIGGDTQMVISVKEGAELVIGNRVGISNAAIVCHEKIVIGDRTIIGGGTKIYDSNFHSVDYRERGDYAHETVITRPISIGEDVFIGAHCIILKGVTIGDRSIVAAGSVVTKDIPVDEVWGGNPARKIRSQAE